MDKLKLMEEGLGNLKLLGSSVKSVSFLACASFNKFKLELAVIKSVVFFAPLYLYRYSHRNMHPAFPRYDV